MQVTYADDLIQAVQLTPAEFVAQVRLMAALKMFELGKLSAPKAAELANMSRVDFMEACGRYQVSLFNYPDSEVEQELLADMASFQQNRP